MRATARSFFLAFDTPRYARVINMSVDLCLFGSGATPAPPVSAYVRVIAEPCLRLVSLDLNVAADVATLAELFDFSADYLGLLKAAAIAGGLVPPWLEHAEPPVTLAAHLQRCVRVPGMRGVEIVTHVRDIPKGSRLAVSTTLCACVIAAVMRLTGQTAAPTGTLSEEERRTVCSRAILAEWLGGSGGGWQDSGGVWPGLKQIVGVTRADGGGGELLPRHVPIPHAAALAQRLKRGLVMVHGGMAQDVGPLLEVCASGVWEGVGLMACADGDGEVSAAARWCGAARGGTGVRRHFGTAVAGQRRHHGHPRRRR